MCSFILQYSHLFHFLTYVLNKPDNTDKKKNQVRKVKMKHGSTALSEQQVDKLNHLLGTTKYWAINTAKLSKTCQTSQTAEGAGVCRSFHCCYTKQINAPRDVRRQCVISGIGQFLFKTVHYQLRYRLQRRHLSATNCLSYL